MYIESNRAVAEKTRNLPQGATLTVHVVILYTKAIHGQELSTFLTQDDAEAFAREKVKKGIKFKGVFHDANLKLEEMVTGHKEHYRGTFLE